MNDLHLEDQFFRLHPNGSDSELAEFKKLFGGLKSWKAFLKFLGKLAQSDLNVGILPSVWSADFEG